MPRELTHDEANLVIDAIEYQLASLERQTQAKRKSPAIAEAYRSLHLQYQNLLHHFRELAGQTALPLPGYLPDVDEQRASSTTKRGGK